MTRVTKFAARDPGPAARVSGFLAHLRLNGLRLGVAETETAIRALSEVAAHNPSEARAALKAVCAGCADEAKGFDALFDAYWMNGGRVTSRIAPTSEAKPAHTRITNTQDGLEATGSGSRHSPDGNDDGDASNDGEGKLIASRVNNLMKKDLRDLVSASDIAEAERVAERLGRAIRDRRSRRRKAMRKGDEIDFRRLVRRSLATGGEPIDLPRKARPDRPVKFTALADVSGSMTAYARPYLAFLAGLMRADSAADAYIFHTRLVRITEALRDPDAMRALNRLTLLSDGFGGGSKIGANLSHFARSYAPGFVDGRTVVFILSDGYDSDSADEIGVALQTLKRRGCRIVWLNPLKGWKDYEPVAKGMAAALPHLDGFYAANTLVSMAALEQELERL
ncbi:MAG: VWA domain-containing protein [Rhodobacteraceae bacterium]|nr:VWA domain-containing protein [Paracoccaceae bacterium]